MRFRVFLDFRFSLAKSLFGLVRPVPTLIVYKKRGKRRAALTSRSSAYCSKPMSMLLGSSLPPPPSPMPALPSTFSILSVNSWLAVFSFTTWDVWYASPQRAGISLEASLRCWSVCWCQSCWHPVASDWCSWRWPSYSNCGIEIQKFKKSKCQNVKLTIPIAFLKRRKKEENHIKKDNS